MILMRRSTGRYSVSAEWIGYRWHVLRRFPDGTWTGIAVTRTAEEAVQIVAAEVPEASVHPGTWRVEPTRRADGLITWPGGALVWDSFPEVLRRG